MFVSNVRLALLPRVATGLLLVGALAACSTTSLQSRITAVTPNVLQQGRSATVSVQLEAWAPNTQLALMPAGPYRTHQLPLSAKPLTLAFDGQRGFVAGADGLLSIVDFPEQADAARQLGQARLAAPASRLQVQGQRLLALLVDGRLQWFDVSRLARPKLLATLSATDKVRDFQLAGKESGDKGFYLMLEDEAAKSRLQRWSLANGQARVEREWSLPRPAVAFAQRGQYLWTVGQAGIAVLDISGEQAELKAETDTTGTPSDIQLQDELALVADGRGGLVVFDISKPDVLQWRGSFNKRGAIRGFAAGDDDALLTLQDGTLLRLGLSNPELPSSGAAYRVGQPLVACAFSGDVALLVTEYGLQRVVMAGGGKGAISAEGLNLGGSRRGVIRGDILYVADWFSGLHLYDISDPRQVRHLSNYHTPGSSKGVELFGNFALVGDDDWGLQIIDVENPRQPKWAAELPPEAMARLGLAYTMKRVGEMLYLADHRGGFHIIDLSDIYHPQRLGGYDTPGKAWDIDVRDNVAFVADDRGGLLMFDVSDPTQPKPFAQFNPGGQAEDVALQDGRAYVAFFDRGLYTLDIRNPREAKVIGHTPIPGNARSIELGDDLLYVASWEAGLQVVDTRGSGVPKIIGRFDTDGAAWGVKVKDGFAYVLDWWGGIKVVDVRQPSRPTAVGRYHARGTLQQLDTRGTYLYAASGAAGLQVYDIKNPLNPIWLQGLDIDGQAQALAIEDGLAYVAAGDGGVAIFDILDPFYTHQVGVIDTPGVATNLQVVNDYLYIADDRAGLLVMDVRDPQRPLEVARYDMSVWDMWLDGQTLWLVNGGAGLSGWTVANNGKLSQRVSLPDLFSRVRAKDGLLIASTFSGVVHLWRLEEQGLRPLAEFDSGDAVSDLQIVGESLYVLGPRRGLRVLDISRPQAPRLTAVYPATGRHTSVAIARGAAFFAGENKLASVAMLPMINVSPIKQDAQASAPHATELMVELPTDLPRGRYHLVAVDPTGRQRVFANALSLQFAPPGRKNTTLDAMRQLLKTPLKPPAEAETVLPSSP